MKKDRRLSVGFWAWFKALVGYLDGPIVAVCSRLVLCALSVWLCRWCSQRRAAPNAPGPNPLDPSQPLPRNGSECESRLTDLNRWPSLYLCPRAPNASCRKASAAPFINLWQTRRPTSGWVPKGQIRNELKWAFVRRVARLRSAGLRCGVYLTRLSIDTASSPIQLGQRI